MLFKRLFEILWKLWNGSRRDNSNETQLTRLNQMRERTTLQGVRTLKSLSAVKKAQKTEVAAVKRWMPRIPASLDVDDPQDKAAKQIKELLEM